MYSRIALALNCNKIEQILHKNNYQESKTQRPTHIHPHEDARMWLGGQLYSGQMNEWQVTSKNGFTKPGRLLFGEALNVFCRSTWFSSSKLQTFSSKLEFKKKIQLRKGSKGGAKFWNIHEKEKKNAMQFFDMWKYLYQ